MNNVKGTGFSTSDAATLLELIKDEVPRQGSHAVVDKDAEAQLILQPKLIRLERSFVISLEKLDSSRKLRYSSQLKVSNADEFDTAATRLVRSVLKETPLKNDARIGDVTQGEASGPLQKKETSKYWLVGFGPSALFGSNSQGVSYGFSLGYEWDIETQAGVKIFYSGAFDPDGGVFSSLGLGGAYFFSDGDTAPLIWGDFGFGSARKNGTSNVSNISGFQLGIGPALRLFRTSKINVEIQGRYAVILRKFDKGGTPSTMGLQVLILF